MRGERLKDLRTRHGYSRDKLANLLDIGEASIPRYEANASLPSSEVVMKIAVLFGVTADYLLGLTDDPTGYKDGGALTPSERGALALMRMASPEDQTRILRVLEVMTDHGSAGV
jgi:transcriptional regulator with XRE-family HTH domain